MPVQSARFPRSFANPAVLNLVEAVTLSGALFSKAPVVVCRYPSFHVSRMHPRAVIFNDIYIPSVVGVSRFDVLSDGTSTPACKVLRPRGMPALAGVVVSETNEAVAEIRMREFTMT